MASPSAKSPLQATFILRLSEEMTRRGISQKRMEQLAKGLGLKLSQTHISGLLAGINDPTLYKVYAVSQVLDVPASSLLTLGTATDRSGSPRTNVVPLAVPAYTPIFPRAAEPSKRYRKRRRK